MGWEDSRWNGASAGGWATNGKAGGKGKSAGKGASKVGKGGGFVPRRGGGDWGKRQRQNEQVRIKDEKSQREADYFWQVVEQNKKWDSERGGAPPQKGARRLKEEEEELFGAMSGNVGIDFDRYQDIPADVSGSAVEKIPKIKQFDDLWEEFELPDFLWENVQRMKYKVPTPIQTHAIPAALAGRDLMCCAQTGSGKTFAFLFPIFSLLAQDQEPDSSEIGMTAPRALVLSPTRELSSQTFTEARKLSFMSNFRTVEVYGGVEARPQLKELARGAEILVATPGRLIDFVDRGIMTLADISFLVLDEADRMLDMGFEPQIREIVEKRDMPRDTRQTLLFSATFPTEIQKLAKSFLWNYVWIGIGKVGAAAETVQQSFVLTTDSAKPDKLMQSLKQNPKDTTLVFCAMKRTAHWLDSHLRRNGFQSAAIHGDMEQRDREYSLNSFRSGRTMILVATDVAARGLDIPAVSHVVNYDLPGNIDDYVHRIGRTGRIGRRGWATAFFVAQGRRANTNVLRDLIKLLKKANQEVPDFLLEEAQWNSRGNEGKGGSASGNFGGRDYRSAEAKNGGSKGSRPGATKGGKGGSSWGGGSDRKGGGYGGGDSGNGWSSSNGGGGWASSERW